MNIKACPFCKGLTYKFAEMVANGGAIGTCVVCSNCEAQGPIAYTTRGADKETVRRKGAITLWNDRTGRFTEDRNEQAR